MHLRVAKARRQVAGIERSTIRAKYDRPLDDVAQLTCISGPVMGLHPVQHRRRNAGDPAAMLQVHLVQHGLCHGGQIFKVVA